MMTDPTTLGDNEGLEILYSYLAKLNPVFGSFILSIDDQFGLPLCCQGFLLFLITSGRAYTFAHTNSNTEIFWKIKMIMDVLCE